MGFLSSQRGAMFGLDARLAMVIFGALAIVAGFVGISRITTAKEARLLREIIAFDDALLQYQTDLGTFLPFTLKEGAEGQDLTALWDKDLIKPGFQSRWNGPYVTMESLQHPLYGRWSVVYAQSELTDDFCTSETECFLWLKLTNVPKDMWLAVNRTLDEGHGTVPEDISQAPYTGRVRGEMAEKDADLFYRSVERKR